MGAPRRIPTTDEAELELLGNRSRNATSGALVPYTLATRPAASAGNRGLQIILSDAGYMGGADVVQTCVRTSGGGYEWADGTTASS